MIQNMEETYTSSINYKSYNIKNDNNKKYSYDIDTKLKNHFNGKILVFTNTEFFNSLDKKFPLIININSGSTGVTYLLFKFIIDDVIKYGIITVNSVILNQKLYIDYHKLKIIGEEYIEIMNNKPCGCDYDDYYCNCIMDDTDINLIAKYISRVEIDILKILNVIMFDVCPDLIQVKNYINQLLI
jgi:hypothetical protein